jgi:cysteine synthase A
MTSGNMGSALAAVCTVSGNPFIATMSEGNSPERAKMMRGLGAEVILVPQVNGSPGKVTGKDIAAAIEIAVRIANDRNAFYVDQFNNPASVLAHEQTTGPEIWNEIGRDLDAFVAAVGSGGAFIGTARFLKSRNPAIVCAPVEPYGAEFLAGRPVTKPDHILQGTGYGLRPRLWEPALADVFLSVTDDEATAMRIELGRLEGLYVGFSAAANVCAAKKLIASGRLGTNPTVATILCDTGLKY